MLWILVVVAVCSRLRCLWRLFVVYNSVVCFLYCPVTGSRCGWVLFITIYFDDLCVWMTWLCIMFITFVCLGLCELILPLKCWCGCCIVV